MAYMRAAMPFCPPCPPTPAVQQGFCGAGVPVAGGLHERSVVDLRFCRIGVGPQPQQCLHRCLLPVDSRHDHRRCPDHPLVLVIALRIRARAIPDKPLDSGRVARLCCRNHLQVQGGLSLTCSELHGGQTSNLRERRR